MTTSIKAQSLSNLDRFREQVSEARRKTGRLQMELARELGIDPQVLSRKLHGAKQAILTHVEVKQIISTLAAWDAITTRGEAGELLSLMGLRTESFSDEEWRAEPLNRLAPAEPASQATLPYSTPSSLVLSLPSSLPAPSTALIGRELHTQQALERLRSVRLLTLRGTGGVGKTRLALEVARAAQQDFADGVYFVSLATIRDASLVPPTLVQALHLSEPIGRDGVEGQNASLNEDLLKSFLAHKALLLVLDNVEQIPDIAHLVGDLLAIAPALKIMVTSRAVLRLYGEHEFDVPPLEICSPDQGTDLDTLARCPAIRLFVERAQAVNPAFQVNLNNAAIIAQICTRLDGLPLAIELAAARTKVYPLSAILERLAGTSGQSLSFLRSTASNALQHHHTLHETLDWSYELLDPQQQRLFCRLSVFVGGWTLPAAVAICAEEEPGPPAVSEDDLFAQMEALLDHSLARRAMPDETPPEQHDQPRFYYLETIRDYALERLEARAEREEMQRRHAYHFLDVVQRIEPELSGRDQSRAVWLLAQEQDNVRAALTWAIERGEAELALHICGAFSYFWEARTQFQEAHRWIDAVLAMPQPVPTPPAIRAKLLMAASRLALWEIACERSRELAQEALALYEAVGNTDGKTMAIFQIGDTWHMQGEYAQATGYLEESLLLFREQANWRCYAFTLSRLGAMALLQADYAQAWTRLSEAVPLLREYSEPGLLNVSLVYLGVLALLQGDYAQSIHHLREGLLLAQHTGNRYMLATALIAFGCILGMKSGPELAAHVCSAAEALFESLNTALPAAYRPLYDSFLGMNRARVDEAQWEIWWAEGRAASVDEIATLVLDASGE